MHQGPLVAERLQQVKTSLRQVAVLSAQAHLFLLERTRLNTEVVFHVQDSLHHVHTVVVEFVDDPSNLVALLAEPGVLQTLLVLSFSHIFFED